MTYHQLIKHYGSAVKIGKALGVSKQAVHRWKYSGVPMEQQIAAEVDSGGAMKADLTKNVEAVIRIREATA